MPLAPRLPPHTIALPAFYSPPGVSSACFVRESDHHGTFLRYNRPVSSMYNCPLVSTIEDRVLRVLLGAATGELPVIFMVMVVMVVVVVVVLRYQAGLGLGGGVKGVGSGPWGWAWQRTWPDGQRAWLSTWRVDSGSEAGGYSVPGTCGACSADSWRWWQTTFGGNSTERYKF